MADAAFGPSRRSTPGRDRLHPGARSSGALARSAAGLERVGMCREGHLLESTWSKGEWTNELLYAVLRREWPAGR
jgi:hypothetical protein